MKRLKNKETKRKRCERRSERVREWFGEHLLHPTHLYEAPFVSLLISSMARRKRQSTSRPNKIGSTENPNVSRRNLQG